MTSQSHITLSTRTGDDMKVKMTSRKVGFRWNEKNVKDFIDGFRIECETKNYVKGINLAVNFYLEPTMILNLRFCKEIYDQQRYMHKMQTASFSQGVAAAFYMINSRDDECS